MDRLFRPLEETEMTEKAVETLGRVQELFESRPIPSPLFSMAHVPAFFHDFYMNLKRFVLSPGKLDVNTKALVGYAASLALKTPYWIQFFKDHALSIGVTEPQLRGAAAVTSACAMYNVFFKFRDIAGKDSFTAMPVGLRAHVFGDSGLEERTVEIINVAVSDINGCKPCTSGHVTKALALDVSEEALLEAVQVAAVVAAAATFEYACQEG
jgi:alkyl hydroperoxide reductase subunit D